MLARDAKALADSVDVENMDASLFGSFSKRRSEPRGKGPLSNGLGGSMSKSAAKAAKASNLEAKQNSGEDSHAQQVLGGERPGAKASPKLLQAKEERKDDGVHLVNNTVIRFY